MKALKLSGKRFRNLNEFEFDPTETVNVIYGDNAQGKTNLLEALWVFTGGKSFRGSKDSELIAIGSENSVLELDFFAYHREQTAKIKIEGKRENSVNGILKKTSAEMVGEFSCVFFAPSSLNLIKEGPAMRRKFLDAAICQAKPVYTSVLSRYNKALKQRNALLKDIKYSSSLLDLLEVWEEELAVTGAQVIVFRNAYTEKLFPKVKSSYSGISGEKEEIEIKYISETPNFNMKKLEIYDILRNELKKVRSYDIKQGFTSIGAHRDDLDIKINGLSAKAFGSQGQQRSCVLALKLAEAAVLKDVTGEEPVALLDDVMSELDLNRQDYLLNRLKDNQVFITCCDPAPLLRLTDGKVFKMENGKLN